ncbi:unnamed protein product, partial [Symbiodinium pilosum]
MKSWLLQLLLLSSVRYLDAATLRRSRMTTAEQKMSARMKAMAPEKATLMNMEASVLNMARLAESGKGAASATNLTDFLKEIQQLIQNSMKKSILVRMNQTQIDLDEAWANLSTCTHPNDTQFVEELAELDAKHIQCRQSEANLYNNFQTTCVLGWKIYTERIHALCAAYMQSQDIPNPTSTCVMGGDTPVPTIGNYLKDMAAHFRGEYEAVVEKRLKCQNASSTPFVNLELCKQMMCQYWDTRMECSKTQASFEQRACDVHKTYTCSKFAECYTERRDIYQDIQSLAEQTEVTAKVEWRMVNRIECYIAALGQPKDGLAEAIDTCKGKIFSASSVELVYKGPAPAQRECTEVFLPPGSAVFSSTWYHAVPSVEAECTIEAILRLPISRLALETQSLEIAALNDAGQVVAKHAFQLQQLVKAPNHTVSFQPCHLRLEDGTDRTIAADVQVRLMGLHRAKHETAVKRLAIQGAEDDASSESEASENEPETVAPIDRSFSLEWVNRIYGKLHPKISIIIARMMEDRFGQITQMLQAKMPGPLKDIHFKYFRLG